MSTERRFRPILWTYLTASFISYSDMEGRVFERELLELDGILRTLPHVVTGRGPLHPTSPREELREVIQLHLDSLRLIEIDPHYAAFLLAYAGASIAYPDESIYIDVFGFSDGVSTNLLDPGGDYVDTRGFYLFCSSVFRAGPNDDLASITGVEFAFDTTTRRPPGVYRAFTRMGVEGEYSHFQPSFIAWLNAVAASALSVAQE